MMPKSSCVGPSRIIQSKNMKTKLRKFGDEGEKIAENFLVKNNYKILERNWTCREGELDIIAQEKEEIVFAEVKTRKSAKFGSAEDAVDDLKLGKIIQACEKYLTEKNYPENVFWRVDVLVVGESEHGLAVISHLENVTI